VNEADVRSTECMIHHCMATHWDSRFRNSKILEHFNVETIEGTCSGRYDDFFYTFFSL